MNAPFKERRIQTARDYGLTLPGSGRVEFQSHNSSLQVLVLLRLNSIQHAATADR